MLPGKDCIDAHAVLSQFEGDALVKPDTAELGCGVGGVLETALLARLRVDLYDCATLLRFHHSRGILGTQKIAKQVDVHHGAPFLRRKFGDLLGNEDARVGNHDVEPPEFLYTAIDHGFHLGFVTHIHFDCDCAAVCGGGDAFSSLDCLFFIQVRDDNVTAFFCQSLAKGLSQSLCAASDQRDTIL